MTAGHTREKKNVPELLGTQGEREKNVNAQKEEKQEKKAKWRSKENGKKNLRKTKNK